MRQGGTADSRRWPHVALALLSGCLIGLGQAPFGWWIATLAGFAGLGWLQAGAGGAKRAAWLCWLTGAAAFALSMHWIVEPFLVDVARHGWMAPFALVFLAGGLALFWGAAGWLAARLRGGPVAFALLLALAEFARGHLMTGFPWNLPAYVWLETGLAQAAAWVGPYGLSAVTILLPVLSGAWLHRGQGARRLAALLPVLALAGAALAWPVPPAEAPEADAPVMRLVQPNAPQHLKYDPEHAQRFYRRAVEDTAALPRPDLVVWPETALPGLLEFSGAALDHVADRAGGVPVVLGIVRSEEGTRYYNSLVVLDAEGEIADVYDKHHLVPFGEYLPLGDLLGQLGLSAMADLYGGGYSAGPGPELVDVGRAGRALPLICYEAVFPRDTRGTGARPDLLLQITNDAWFGHFSGPYQHLAQARFRAIEQGLPLVRAANTGVSAAIGPRGQVLARLALDEAGYVDAALPAALDATLYARTGDLPVFCALLLLAGLALVARRRFGR